MLTGDRSVALRNGAPVIALHSAYRFEDYAQDLKLLRRFERHLEWFPPVTNPAQFRNHVGRLTTIRVDNDDNLWTLLSYIDRSWKPTRANDGSFMSTTEMDHRYDKVLEVFAPRDTIPFAGVRVARYFEGFADASHLWRFVMLPDGNDVIEIWRISLHTSVPTSRR